MNPNAVLFVCLGNICRSPSAKSVAEKKAAQARLPIRFDSAGTARYHIGSPADPRAVAAGKKYGCDLSAHKARQVKLEDFYRFDCIFAMDEQNLRDLQRLQQQAQDPSRPIACVQLFGENQAVADPYYGDAADFEAMFVHLQNLADAWIARWRPH